jgi:hypothetical protein
LPTPSTAAHRTLAGQEPDTVPAAITGLVGELFDAEPPARDRARGLGLSVSGDVDRSAPDSHPILAVRKVSPWRRRGEHPSPDRDADVTGRSPNVDPPSGAATIIGTFD